MSRMFLQQALREEHMIHAQNCLLGLALAHGVVEDDDYTVVTTSMPPEAREGGRTK
jgi:hypothetical protein